MSSNQPPSEMREALVELKPFFKRAFWFSLCSGLLILAPTGYMLEVYDRVVNTRSHTTLAMLTILVLAVYILMEVLDWVRSAVMYEAALTFDRRMAPRVFKVIFETNLKRMPGGTVQSMSDLRVIRDFLHSPVVLALMESPVSFVCLVLIFAISPVLGVCALVAAVVQTFVGWLNERSTQPPLAEANRSAAGAQMYAESTLRNAQVIESMGMLRNVHRRWLARQQDFLKLQGQASNQAGTTRRGPSFCKIR